MSSTELVANSLSSRLMTRAIFLTLVILSAACRGAPPAATGPRVLFAQPKDGATVMSPVRFEFGIENYAISPVPKPALEKPREGVGHHHLGVDTDCLPVGEVIPMGQPWIHFGDGRTGIEMQLTPGPHKFALQLGDDQHRTMTGLCSTVSVTVAP